MRTLVSLMHISLDGFAAGPNGELEWAIVDEELMDTVDAMLTEVDMAIYGRITYQMMESYWPTVPSDPNSTKHDRTHSRWVEGVEKIVISPTLESVSWNNTRLIRDNIADEVRALKEKPGKDMMIFGSPRLTHVLMDLGLVDEFRITVNPILLGGGTPLFDRVNTPMHLTLVDSRRFACGVVGLHYKRA